MTRCDITRCVYIHIYIYTHGQGFYAAMRLVSACQLGKDPSLANITLSDPPPQLVGVDSAALASFTQKKWTIEVHVCTYICIYICILYRCTYICIICIL